MFFLLYKYTDDAFFDDFPKISDHFPKVSEDFPKLSRRQTNVPEHFPIISEDVRRFPKTFEEEPKMFRWYTDEFKYNLRDKRDITEIIDIFTCEDIAAFSSMCYHSLYHWLLYNKKRTLHVSSKIWILCSRGKNNISLVRYAHSWDIVLATRT